MSTRYTVQRAVTFDAHQPQFLLVEWFAGGDNAGRCIGQFFTVEEAIRHAHARRAEHPHLTVVEDARKRLPQPEG